MQKIVNQRHSKSSFYHLLSRFFERSAYYGLRSSLILYMVGTTLNMSREDALSIYGFSTICLIFTQIFGALIGDLLLNNKRAIILGGLLQALGAFILCYPSVSSIYIGGSIILLGGGLYTPNIISSFGKQYLHNTKLLDSGFTMFHLVINLGSFIGIVAIAYIGEKFGYTYSFITAGLVYLISIIFILISKDKNQEAIINQKFNGIQIVKVLAAILIVGFFWSAYEISGGRIYSIPMDFATQKVSSIPADFWSSLNFYCVIIIGVFLIIFWSKYYSSRFMKLAFGFLIGAIAFSIMLLIPEETTEKDVILYIISMFLLTASELYVAPVINSIITKNTNPKYLAIVISLIFLPSRAISYLVGFGNDYFYDNPSVSIIISLIAFIAISIGIFIMIFVNKNYLQQRV
ncbi:MFS transporter [Psychroserpens sp. XS_ASV72]|uniref:MFS transporter n=1 Tax=Psychroserpens sp. XS_ASV72 TaxID=3241293 RepID=UPI00351223FA